ncbi:MAG: hypothetical protein GY851_22855 [bacterium]|nr:hypothetical protein [bacterium]
MIGKVFLLLVAGLAQGPAFDLATYPQVDGSTMTDDVSILMACAHLGVPTLGGPDEHGTGTPAGSASGRWLILRDEASVWSGEFCAAHHGWAGRFPRWRADEGPPGTYRVARAVSGIISGHRGLPKAMDSLLEGDAELLLMVGEPMPEDRFEARKRGLELDCVPIAWDALVPLANRENPTVAITTAQVQDAYRRRLTNWGALGGPDEQLRPYQAQRDSTCWRLMKQTLLECVSVESAQEMIEQSMAEYEDWRRNEQPDAYLGIWHPLTEAMHSDTYGLFYATFQCLPDLRTLKPLAIDGVAPSLDTIRSGEYPYVVTVNAIVRSDSPPDSGARQLREWLLGPEGQEALEKCGFVPITACEPHPNS